MIEEKEYINPLVSRKKIEWIAYHYVLSEHVKVAMIRRDTEQGLDLRTRILNSPLAWKTYEGRIAIALDLYSYIIVDTSTQEEGHQVPVVCTYVNTKDNEVNVVDKMLVTYKEFCRERRI